MKQYSFIDDSEGLEDSFGNDDRILKKPRRHLHRPESRETARSGTLGSFASITTKYNNIYNNQESNN